MENIGTVISTANDTLTVKTTRTNACSRCGACKMFGSQEIIMSVKNKVNAEIGDTVLISHEQGIFLKALIILYGIPFTALLIGFIAGYYLSIILNLSNYAALTGFFGGMALSAACITIIKHLDKKREKANKYRAFAVKIIS